MIGQLVVLDATQAGIFAHRLRKFWTNQLPLLAFQSSWRQPSSSYDMHQVASQRQVQHSAMFLFNSGQRA
jgi:hypothetical protein